MTAASMHLVPGHVTPNAERLAPAATRAPRLRLTARGRRAVAALVLLPIGLAVGGLAVQPAFAAMSGSSASAATAGLDTVTVSAGDTLWQIAAEIAVDRDVRDLVADLRAINGLDSAQVEPGQVLLLPNDR